MRTIYHLIFLIFGLQSSSIAQDTFSRIYDWNNKTTEAIVGLEITEDRIFTLAATRCDSSTTDCSVLLEFDASGDIIWKKDLPWLDVGSRSLIVSESELLVSGHEYVDQENYLTYNSSFNGDSLSSGIINPPDSISNVWIRGVKQFDQYSVIYGNALSINSNLALGIAMFVVGGEVDTTLIFEEGDLWNDVADMELDEHNNLSILLTYRETTTNGPVTFEAFRLGVYKYDIDKNLISSWSTDNNDLIQLTYLSSLEILDNGLMILIGDSGVPDHNLQAWGVNATGIIWRHDFPDSSTEKVNINTLTKTANGDIIGCGSILETQTIEGTTGYYFRLSPSGDLIWEKALVDNHNVEFDKKPVADFFDIAEMNDGSLVLGGSQDVWFIDNNGIETRGVDAWLVRTNNDGCIDGPCNFYQDVTTGTSTELVESLNSLSIYPNPTNNSILIEVDDQVTIEELQVFNSTGQMFPSDLQNNKLSLENLSNGIYFLRITDSQGRSTTRKVTKH